MKNLNTLSWNTEFKDAGKLDYFRNGCEEIARRNDIIIITQADEAALSAIAAWAGYNYAVAKDTGAEAVGFLINPRLKLLADPALHCDGWLLKLECQGKVSTIVVPSQIVY